MVNRTIHAGAICTKRLTGTHEFGRVTYRERHSSVPMGQYTSSNFFIAAPAAAHSELESASGRPAPLPLPLSAAPAPDPPLPLTADPDLPAPIL